MFSTVLSATLKGLHVEFIYVEADTSNGLPMFSMVGYLSSEVKEAGERVRTAIRNSGMILPPKKVVINLSPAHIRKRGTMFDLPIAVSVLASLGEVHLSDMEEILMLGELSLDGRVKQVQGVLPIVMEAKKIGCKICIVPKDNQEEGELVGGIQVIGVKTLDEVCCFLRGEYKPTVTTARGKRMQRQNTYALDYSDVRGQYLAKRAVEIAVAGNHNMLMIGPPGTGKSMIAKRIPTILPPLSREESMELTTLYSVVGELDKDRPLIQMRPFREVHHGITKTVLIGGGHYPRPGEISMAHKGVLFLDEIVEFQKSVLEQLRLPLEEHRIRIQRELGEYEFPAEFILVAAMNPCPCGNYPNLNKCTCTTTQIRNYLRKISQPLLDRIDICVEVEKVNYEDLQGTPEEECSAKIRERVCKARKLQRKRYEDLGISTNSQLTAKDMAHYCRLGDAQEKMMRQAFDKMELTARTYYKILSVARTIADLDDKEEIELIHLKEALSYRTVDEKYWRKEI